MKIISWNCNMAFRKKWKAIIDFNPDVIFLQECESPAKFKGYISIPNINQFLWFGTNENKGLGVITFNNTLVEKKKINKNFQFVIPLKLMDKDIELHTFLVWAMPAKNKRNSYVGQLWNAFNYYRLSTHKKYMIIGDWNSHVQWDHERKNGNHSMLISKLKNKDIVSLYHHINELEQGEEKDPTIYLLKKESKPYHLDYCAVSECLINEKSEIKIGAYNQWIKFSDHMPLFINLAN